MVLTKNSEIVALSPVLLSCTSLPRRAKVSSDCCSLLHGSQLHGRSLTAGPTSKHVRRTSCSSVGGLAETTARADQIVTHSLPGGFIFAILLSCWEELGGNGE